jgi:transposase InsO family protein
MAICMAKTIKEERLRWVEPIMRKEIRMVDTAKVCPYSTRSLERWCAAYRRHGEEGLRPQSTEPKRYRTETPIWLKEKVIAVRTTTRKCALRIHWQLRKEGVQIDARTIGKILKKEGLVRRYRVRKVTYKYIRAERKPGELVEIDVKYVPGTIQGRQYYQYTAIDTASRWRYLAVYDGQSTWNAIRFLREVMGRFPYPIQAIKTDNHSTFTNYYIGSNKRSDMTVKTIHALDSFCRDNSMTHYLIDPGKPAQQGTVERSHREDQEKFYEVHVFRDMHDLRRKLKRWNIYYNNLEHCGLGGKTPNEYLKECKLINPPNVCT